MPVPTLQRGHNGTRSLQDAFEEAALLGSYAVADLPAADENAGALVYCSDGAAGSPCLAYSNGTNWLRIALGAAVAAA